MAVEPTPLSASNPRLSSLRRLSGRRRARLDEGRFVVEGPVPVGEALAAGAAIEALYVDAEAWAEAEPASSLRAVVDEAGRHDVPVWSLEPGLLSRVSDTVTPQGLLAVAHRRTAAIDELCARPGPVLVLVDVADPGNLGTLVRTAEAAGAAGVVATGTTTDPFGPKAVRAAAGSVLRLPVAEVPQVLDALTALAAAGRRIVATVARGGVAPKDADLSGPLALLVGSEAHGLAPDVVAAASTCVTIPVASSVDSLNVAIVGAVVLFEAAEQQRHTIWRPTAAPPGTDWTPQSPNDRLGDP